MKKIFLLIIIAITILIYSIFPREYREIMVAEKNVDSYRIMTYNIKNSYQDYEGWVKRREALISQIERISPDILGVQEADDSWMEYLSDNLDEYSYVGLGRERDLTGEHNAVFFRRDLFRLVETETFWLSQKPGEPSRGWDGACNRICTFVELEHIESGEIVKVYNTHLDHKGKLARRNGMELIIRRIEDDKIPSILMGDFNQIENSRGYNALGAVLNDSKYMAAQTMSFGTMNHFSNLHFRYFPPIDFIFTSNDVEVMKYNVEYMTRYNGKPVSDHYPVYIDIRIN